MPTLSRAPRHITYDLHPAAQAAFEWLNQYPRLIPWGRLPTTLRHLLLKNTPLAGVMDYKEVTTEKKTLQMPVAFHFFAPLWPLLYMGGQRPEDDTELQIYRQEELDEQQVALKAWLSNLTLVTLSVDPKSLGHMSSSLQRWMPPDIALELFGKAAINDQDLGYWTNRSRGTLVEQRKKARAKKQSRERANHQPGNIIDQLKQPWSE